MGSVIEAGIVVSLLLVVLGGVWLSLRARFKRMFRESERSGNDFSILESSVMTPEERRKVRQAIVKKMEKDLAKGDRESGDSEKDVLDIERLLKNTRPRR